MKPLVYIAGPYTHPDPVINTRVACLVADDLVAAGYAVVVPHLSLFWHAISPQPVEEWYQRDLDVMAHCDAVLRIAGESTGADAEVDVARHLGIPVYFDLADLPSDVQSPMSRFRDLAASSAESAGESTVGEMS